MQALGDLFRVVPIKINEVSRINCFNCKLHLFYTFELSLWTNNSASLISIVANTMQLNKMHRIVYIPSTKTRNLCGSAPVV